MRFDTTDYQGNPISVSIDGFLAKVVELSIKTAQKSNDDRRFLFCGETGSGKSTIKANIAKYIQSLTGREYNVSNIFFDTEEYLRVDVSTSKKILDFDEAAVGLMASDWASSDQKLLMKAAMMDRKKQHYHLLAIPAFEKLKDYIALDRSIGLVYCYKRKGHEIGHFLYYNKRAKERLYREWKKTGVMKYGKFYTFKGTFPNNLGLLIDEEAYDLKKDQAISNLAKQDKSKSQVKLEEKIEMLQSKLFELAKIAQIPFSKLPELLNIPGRTMRDWRNELKIDPFSKESEVLKPSAAATLLNNHRPVTTLVQMESQ